MNEIKTEKRTAEPIRLSEESLARADFMALRTPEWKIASARLDIKRLGDHYGLTVDRIQALLTHVPEEVAFRTKMKNEWGRNFPAQLATVKLVVALGKALEANPDLPLGVRGAFIAHTFRNFPQNGDFEASSAQELVNNFVNSDHARQFNLGKCFREDGKKRAS